MIIISGGKGVDIAPLTEFQNKNNVWCKIWNISGVLGAALSKSCCRPPLGHTELMKFTATYPILRMFKRHARYVWEPGYWGAFHLPGKTGSSGWKTNGMCYSIRKVPENSVFWGNPLSPLFSVDACTISRKFVQLKSRLENGLPFQQDGLVSIVSTPGLLLKLHTTLSALAHAKSCKNVRCMYNWPLFKTNV